MKGNRKPYPNFRMLPFSMTLSDLIQWHEATRGLSAIAELHALLGTKHICSYLTRQFPLSVRLPRADVWSVAEHTLTDAFCTRWRKCRPLSRDLSSRCLSSSTSKSRLVHTLLRDTMTTKPTTKSTGFRSVLLARSSMKMWSFALGRRDYYGIFLCMLDYELSLNMALSEPQTQRQSKVMTI